MIGRILTYDNPPNPQPKGGIATFIDGKASKHLTNESNPASIYSKVEGSFQSSLVGKNIKVVGRIQSRQYEKKFDNGTIEKRFAYEVSVSKLEIIE